MNNNMKENARMNLNPDELEQVNGGGLLDFLNAFTGNSITEGEKYHKEDRTRAVSKVLPEDLNGNFASGLLLASKDVHEAIPNGARNTDADRLVFKKA